MLAYHKMLVAFLLLGCASQSIAQNGQPEVTPAVVKSRAIKIAMDFSQQMGHPINGQASAQSSASTILENEPNQPLPKWKFTFYDGKNYIDVDVEATTGVISHYINRRDIPDPRPEDAPISKAQAITQARDVLASAGALRTSELKFQDAELMRTSANSAEWNVSWSRIFNGVPYREQGATVGFDADTGQLIGFGVRFHTLAPESATANVSQEQAEKIAAKQLASVGYELETPVNVGMEVIQPNTFWQPGGSETQTAPYARVAWMCQFAVTSHSYEVWVDRETGQVVGGSQASNMGLIRRPVAKLTARKAKASRSKH